VSRGNFYPTPKVDSTLVHIRPKDVSISKSTEEIIGALMMHKKKKVRNAIVDSAKTLNKEKHQLATAVDSVKNSNKRPFQLKPEELLEIATELEELY
jgi:16S rRNA A1518/A1519 N6-dimethyltransferase RsmA/KsgA/DIM1 with predicted DNA glycosylase/AP lyase activity